MRFISIEWLHIVCEKTKCETIDNLTHNQTLSILKLTICDKTDICVRIKYTNNKQRYKEATLRRMITCYLLSLTPGRMNIWKINSMKTIYVQRMDQLIIVVQAKVRDNIDLLDLKVNRHLVVLLMMEILWLREK